MNREKNNLSIIQLDRSIAYELQKPQKNTSRLAELFFYRGKLLHDEKRIEEAISAYTRSLSYSGEKWILDEVHFNRGLAYTALGTAKSQRQSVETLVSSQLYWFGTYSKAESVPNEFIRAELDFKTIEAPKAKERLMQIYLITGKIREAETLFNQLRSAVPDSDDEAKIRFKTYEILLLEAKGDLQKADSLKSKLIPMERIQNDSSIDEIRAHRLVKPISFDWIDQTTHDMAVHGDKIKSSIEATPFYRFVFNYSIKRLMFENAGAGFLVSGKAKAFGLFNQDRNGLGAEADVMGTFLNETFSIPGGGFSCDFKTFKGSGQRILKISNTYVSEKSESRFGIHLNAGIQHKLLAFASYSQKKIWLNDLSSYLSDSQEMFDNLGIEVTESRNTKGVYGMGNAGTGWHPEKTNMASSEKSIGIHTNITKYFSLGAAHRWLTSDMTDQDELTVNHSSYTYAHNAFFNERISLLQLNAEMRFGIFGLKFALGGHHWYELSSKIFLNSRSAQVVQSVPEPNGIHHVLASDYDGHLSDEQIAYARKITGYLPSAFGLYFRMEWSNLVFSVEYTENGLRMKNDELRFSLGIKSREKFLSQYLHDLAPWR